jgi:hypothetical protein
VLVTNWVVSPEAGAHDLALGARRRQPDIGAYREAVSDVCAELDRLGESPCVATAEGILARRLTEPEFAMVFAAMPSGREAAIQHVLHEIRIYDRSARRAAVNLARMVQIALLAKVDDLWWGHEAPYHSDADVHNAPDLLDLDPLKREGLLLFQYRRQPSSMLGRVARSAERRAVPGRTPKTAGLRFACARAELIVVLNQIAADFARLAPPGTPRLWVTSLTRSVSHQRHLRSLGYAALFPSAHCVGYAADIEMHWFRRFQADSVLRGLLLDRQRSGEINVIDEGQAWHLCICPGAGRALPLVPDPQTAG